MVEKYRGRAKKLTCGQTHDLVPYRGGSELAFPGASSIVSIWRPFHWDLYLPSGETIPFHLLSGARSCKGAEGSPFHTQTYPQSIFPAPSLFPLSLCWVHLYWTWLECLYCSLQEGKLLTSSLQIVCDGWGEGTRKVWLLHDRFSASPHFYYSLHPFQTHSSPETWSQGTSILFLPHNPLPSLLAGKPPSNFHLQNLVVIFHQLRFPLPAVCPWGFIPFLFLCCLLRSLEREQT